MAGHAPKIVSWNERVQHWLAEASDARVSLAMLALTAAVVTTVLYLLNHGFLA